MKIDVPSDFLDFAAIYGEEHGNLSVPQRQLIDQAIYYLQYEAKVRNVRDFLQVMLHTQDESMLGRLWWSTSPNIAFGGDGDVYRRFFQEVLGAMDTALKTGKLER